MNVKAIFILLVLVGLVLLATEYWARQGGGRAFFARKLLHIAGVGTLAVAPLFFSSYNLLGAVALFFSFLLFLAVHYRWIKVDIYGRKSWGIALFAPAFLVLWAIWGNTNPLLVIQSMLVLALADPAAAIAGKYFPKDPYNLTGDTKTLAGSAAFFMVAFLVLAGFSSLHSMLPFSFLTHIQVDMPIGRQLMMWAFIALLAALSEGVSSGGWDNLSVPLLTGWLTYMLFNFYDSHFFTYNLVLLGLIFCGFLAYRFRWLNGGGSITAIFLGLILFLANGWPALVLMGAFFVTGSLTSKMVQQNEGPTDAKHGKARDYMQVICNGGVAAVCLIIFSITYNDRFLILFAISVAISTADTWSSDIGRRLGGRVVDIKNGKSLPAGISGGISWQGTLAGLAGAFFIAVMAKWINFIDKQVWLIGLAGFAGMLVDSLLGSFFQARFRFGEKGENTWGEYIPEGKKGVLEKGFLWMTNDRVNVLSNLIVTLLCAFVLIFCL
jgi:uncharacterized protein (TIGR00297 family)